MWWGNQFSYYSVKLIYLFLVKRNSWVHSVLFHVHSGLHISSGLLFLWYGYWKIRWKVPPFLPTPFPMILNNDLKGAAEEESEGKTSNNIDYCKIEKKNQSLSSYKVEQGLHSLVVFQEVLCFLASSNLSLSLNQQLQPCSWRVKIIANIGASVLVLAIFHSGKKEDNKKFNKDMQ